MLLYVNIFAVLPMAYFQCLFFSYVILKKENYRLNESMVKPTNAEKKSYLSTLFACQLNRLQCSRVTDFVMAVCASFFHLLVKL